MVYRRQQVRRRRITCRTARDRATVRLFDVAETIKPPVPDDVGYDVCMGCGYLLAGLPSRYCPECDFVNDRSEDRRMLERLTRSPLRVCRHLLISNRVTRWGWWWCWEEDPPLRTAARRALANILVGLLVGAIAVLIGNSLLTKVRETKFTYYADDPSMHSLGPSYEKTLWLGWTVRIAAPIMGGGLIEYGRPFKSGVLSRERSLDLRVVRGSLCGAVAASGWLAISWILPSGALCALSWRFRSSERTSICVATMYWSASLVLVAVAVAVVVGMDRVLMTTLGTADYRCFFVLRSAIRLIPVALAAVAWFAVLRLDRTGRLLPWPFARGGFDLVFVVIIPAWATWALARELGVSLF